jgi:hypothetical protein
MEKTTIKIKTMTKLICISTFTIEGKVDNISLNKIYLCKFSDNDKLLIINDKKKPQLVDKLNFVTYNNSKIIRSQLMNP